MGQPVNNNVVAVAVMSIRSLSPQDATNLQLAVHYHGTAIRDTFYNDLSAKAKQIIADYSKDELDSALAVVKPNLVTTVDKSCK